MRTSKGTIRLGFGLLAVAYTKYLAADAYPRDTLAANELLLTKYSDV